MLDVAEEEPASASSRSRSTFAGQVRIGDAVADHERVRGIVVGVARGDGGGVDRGASVPAWTAP